MLGHERQAESGALAGRPLAGPAAPVEALEEVGALGLGHPGAVVLDDTRMAVAGTGTPVDRPGWRSTRTRVTPPA